MKSVESPITSHKQYGKKSILIHFPIASTFNFNTFFPFLFYNSSKSFVSSCSQATHVKGDKEKEGVGKESLQTEMQA